MNRSILAALAFFSIMQSTYGVAAMNQFTRNYGCQKYGKETLDAIRGNGTVFLEGTKVIGLVQVNGSLNAEQSALGSLQVNGEVKLNNCLIHNSATINGSVDAKNTK
jgi:hypothetical protein